MLTTDTTDLFEVSLNLINLRNYIDGSFLKSDTHSILGFSEKVEDTDHFDAHSIVINPDATAFPAIRAWLEERGLLKSGGFKVFGRYGFTRQAVRMTKVSHGIRFRFDNYMDAIMFKMAWAFTPDMIDTIDE